MAVEGSDFLRDTLENGCVPLPGPCDCGEPDCPWQQGGDDGDEVVPMPVVVAGNAVPYLVKRLRLGPIGHGGDRDGLRTVQLYDQIVARVGRAMGEALRMARMAVLPSTQEALETAVRQARNVWDHAVGMVIKARSLPRGVSLFRLLCHAVEQPLPSEKRALTLRAIRVALVTCTQDVDEALARVRSAHTRHPCDYLACPSGWLLPYTGCVEQDRVLRTMCLDRLGLACEMAGCRARYCSRACCDAEWARGHAVRCAGGATRWTNVMDETD